MKTTSGIEDELVHSVKYRPIQQLYDQEMVGLRPRISFKNLRYIFLGLSIFFAICSGTSVALKSKLHRLEVFYTKDCVMIDESLKDFLLSNITEETKINHPFKFDKIINCQDYVNKNNGKTCTCIKIIDVDDDFLGTVFLYYKLDVFFENHRKILRSRDLLQLRGYFDTPLEETNDNAFVLSKFFGVVNPKSKINRFCDPLSYAMNISQNEKGNPISKTYFPCGILADIIYNDTFKLFKYKPYKREAEIDFFRGNVLPIDIKQSDIALNIDQRRFSFPSNIDNLEILPNWQTHYCPRLNSCNWTELLRSDMFNYELLMNWVRPNALSNTPKLMGKIESKERVTLGKGRYILLVNLAYPKFSKNNHRRFILANISLFGNSLGYITVSNITISITCLILTICFFNLTRFNVTNDHIEFIEFIEFNENSVHSISYTNY
ncbi:hypothetical protein SNEBB_005367 [Seison nebaliae]|nr:hypothetical protein SNEBB_005367 [Seison nebaliae]